MLLMYGLLLAVSTLKLGVYTSNIRLSPSQVNVVENASVTLTCSKENGNLSECGWTSSQINEQTANLFYYNGQCIRTRFLQIQDLFDGICNGDGTFSVLLKRVDRTQHGAIWQCKEILFYSNKVTINVSVPVASVDIYSPTETYMKENHSQTIRCKPSACRPQPTIGWLLRNPMDLSEYNVTEHSEQTTTENEDGLIASESLLNLIPNRSIHGWMLMCKAWTYDENSAVLSKDIMLNVSYPPDGPPVISGIQNGNSYSVVERNRGKLSCTVTGGNPLPKITWSCFNSSVSDIKRNGSIVSSVTWTALRYQDQRPCICVAGHPFGSNFVSVIIDVLFSDKAQVSQFYIGDDSSEEKSVTVSEDDNVTFSCNIESKTAPIATLSHNGRIINVSVNNTSLVYTRKNIQCNDFGLYVCSAMNEYNNGKPSTRKLPLFVNCSTTGPNNVAHSSSIVTFVAVGVGTFVAALLLVGSALIVYRFMRRRHRHKRKVHNDIRQNTDKTTSSTAGNNELAEYELVSMNPVETRPLTADTMETTSSTVDINEIAEYEPISMKTSETSAFTSDTIETTSNTACNNELAEYELVSMNPVETMPLTADTMETTSSTVDINEIAEYEPISMKTAETSAFTSDTIETLTGNEPTQQYERLDQSQKETDQYSQLLALYEQVEASSEKTEVGSIDNKETECTFQDCINISI